MFITVDDTCSVNAVESQHVVIKFKKVLESLTTVTNVYWFVKRKVRDVAYVFYLMNKLNNTKYAVYIC